MGDGFNVGRSGRIPINLNADEFFTVRVDYCPEGIGLYKAELIVKYGEDNICKIPLEGSAGTIFNMNYCEDFDDWETGEILGEGWTGSVPANYSVYIGSVVNDWYKPYGIESQAIILLNNLRINNTIVPIEVTTPGIRVCGNNLFIIWVEMSVTDSDNRL